MRRSRDERLIGPTGNHYGRRSTFTGGGAHVTDKPFERHLAERQAAGLVDQKWYVRNPTGVTPSLALAEAEALFDAIERGAVEPFSFDD